jgi:hypothetical protein
MADKTELNLARIRACDEEIWRTIRGAKVLIDAGSGEIKGGAGGKLNGQKFKPSFGRSLKTGKKALLPSIHTKFSHHKGSKAELLQRLKGAVEKPMPKKSMAEVHQAYKEIENFNLWGAYSLKDLDEKKKELDKKMAEFPAIYAQLDKSTVVKDPNKGFDVAYFDLSKPDPVKDLQEHIDLKYQNVKKIFLQQQATAKAKDAWKKVVKYKTAMGAAKSKDGKIKNQQKLADAYEEYKAAVAESPYGAVNFKPKTSSVEALLKKTPQDFMLEALEKKLAQTENNLKKGLTNQNSNANMSTTQALNQLASAAKPAKSSAETYNPKATDFPDQGLAGFKKTPVATDDKAMHKKLLGKSQEVWQSLDNKARKALTHYTGTGYIGINDALRQVKKGVPLSKAPASTRSEIEAMTDAIDKSSYDHDIQVVRGVNISTGAKFLGIDTDTLQFASVEELQKLLVGTAPQDLGFVSTGVAEGKGFGIYPINFNILCPAGTKMMYCEPFSLHGHGTRSSDWDGKDDPVGTKNPSGEQEALLQRGTRFVVQGVRKEGKHTVFDLQVVSQDPQ